MDVLVLILLPRWMQVDDTEQWSLACAIQITIIRAFDPVSSITDTVEQYCY